MPHVTWCCKHDNVAISKAVAGKPFFSVVLFCVWSYSSWFCFIFFHRFILFHQNFHTERKWNIDRSHRWKEATFSNDPRWKIQRHTAKIYLLIFLWHFTNLGWYWMIFHWFSWNQQGWIDLCSDCHLMQLGTISFFSLLLLLHLLLCLQQWIAGNFSPNEESESSL